MKKITILSLVGLILCCGVAIWADDDIENNMASTPELLKKWSNSSAATLLPNGGPKGRPAIKITNDKPDASRLIQYQLDLNQVRGKIIELTADVKAENVSKGPKNYLGIKLMIIVTQADNTKKHFDIMIGKSGSYNWRDYEVKAEIPQDAKKVTLCLGLQSATGAVYFSDIDVDVDD